MTNPKILIEVSPAGVEKITQYTHNAEELVENARFVAKIGKEIERLNKAARAED